MKINKEIMISNLIKCFNLEETENCYIFNMPFRRSTKSLKISKLDFEENIEFLEKLDFDDTLLYNSKYFEQLLFLRSTFNLFSASEIVNISDLESNKISIEDSKNGLIYELSKPSIEFILASYSELDLSNMDKLPSLFYADYLRNESSHPNLNTIKRNIKRKLVYRGRYFRDKTSWDFEELLRAHSTSFTVKIMSHKNIDLDIFDKLCNSFLFLFGYHRNVSIMDFRKIEPNVKPIKDLRTYELNFPKKIYNKTLNYYYQQALSTSNPVLKYLSYYQILEHFFDIVANEKLVNDVIEKINHPDFSTKHNNSIDDLIQLIKNRRRDDTKDLEFVLKKYLKIDNLKKDLLEYDADYYKYLKNNKVEFADAQKIKDEGERGLIQSISGRISKIRNALIHTKHGEKNVYIPFTEHEEELLNELPFIRLIAEQIIINSSEEITI